MLAWLAPGGASVQEGEKGQGQIGPKTGNQRKHANTTNHTHGSTTVWLEARALLVMVSLETSQDQLYNCVDMQ